MNLGQLIKNLNALDPEAEIRLLGGGYVGRFTSYRGSYDQLALENGTDYADGFEEQGYVKHENVAEFLHTARDTVGKNFEGYKGGVYTMGEETPIWLAEWGESGSIALLDIVPIEGDQGQLLRYVLKGYDISDYQF